MEFLLIFLFLGSLGSVEALENSTVQQQCPGIDCVNCTSLLICIKCKNFIMAESAVCVDRCNGQAEVRENGPLQGNVCFGSSDDKTTIIIGVVAGVGSGLILSTIVIIFVCIYLRKTRRNVRLQNHQYKSPQIEMGSMKKFPVYNNLGFVNEKSSQLKTGVVDPITYSIQLEQLRPHTETLMTLLSEIRPKLRAMDQSDARVPTYKGVIHQLCRVLVLLHRKDTGSSIPSDALGLLEWAQQMLEDYQQQDQEPDLVGPDMIGEFGQNRISYIDVDMDTVAVRPPVMYAEPRSSKSHSLVSGSEVNPYSSTPVPLLANSLQPDKAFATIHRAPTVPSAISDSKGIYFRPSAKQTNGVVKTKNNNTVGYFANGRYYDPNPMPQCDVYAPASSYSDRSTNRLSTFVPNHPRSHSLSTSESSSEGDGVDGEGSGSDDDVDMFPFDPKDATEPVEV